MSGEPGENGLTLQEAHERARSMAKEGRTKLAFAAELNKEILSAIEANGLQEDRFASIVRADDWSVRQLLREDPRYFSAAGQDEYLDKHVFKGRERGVFVEVGAYDGIIGSNCVFFEKFCQWTGLLIEAAPGNADRAKANRAMPVAACAVGAEEGEEDFLLVTEGYPQTSGLVSTYDDKMKSWISKKPDYQSEVIRVPTRKLADILHQFDLRTIDYISLDIEGAELDVLSSFPFETIPVTAWTIENNGNSSQIRTLMEARDYDFVTPLGSDELYVRRAAAGSLD